MQQVVDFVNPLWRQPALSDDFVFILKFPIKNTGYSPIIPEGQVTLEENGSFLKGIGSIGTSTTASGKLVDYLPINESRQVLEPGQEQVFDVIWRGF